VAVPEKEHSSEKKNRKLRTGHELHGISEDNKLGV
jgi:hypothetical protein